MLMAPIAANQFSIRAMSYLAAILLKRFCIKFDLQHEFIDNQINHWCDLALATDLPAWDTTRDVIYFQLDAPSDLQALVASQELTSTFSDFLEYGSLIGCCELYHAFTGECKTSFLKVIEIAEKNQIRIPEFNIFFEHTRTTKAVEFKDGIRTYNNEFGEPVDSELLKRWEIQLQGVSNG